MISIYCDEDVDIIIKPLLEAKGFKVTTTLDEKMLKASDNQQVTHAIKIGHVFLTHNRVHYEQIFADLITKGVHHPGIIIAARRNVYELAKRISRVLSGYSQESIKNRILYV